MVDRTEAAGFDEFVGFARKISPVQGNFGPQIEIEIEPEDKSILTSKSKTGRFHEWLRLSAKATENSVPTGSVLDLYLKRVEALFRDAKKEESVIKALSYLLDKKIVYQKEQLGRKFEGKDAADHWVPTRLA
jgi:hypothetical protein